MITAQVINVLYNIVDRMYIGHLPAASGSALTGVGVAFPVISIVTAFANLFGSGGAPLFAVARGRRDDREAGVVMNGTFVLLTGSGILLTVLLLAVRRPLLFLLGASEVTFPYADGYLTIYLCGNVFAMLSLGMNNFINAQGYARRGMLTVTIGAVANIILDPVFITGFGMGVEGAALATILSQMLSAAWAVSFLVRRSPVRLRRSEMRLHAPLVRRIVSLGLSTFIMSVTNSLVLFACNTTLQAFGGDLYVGVMTVLNSVREVTITAVHGLTGAAQPVMSYNYGARRYRRVREGIVFLTVSCVIYATAVWALIFFWPRPFISIFSSDSQLMEACVPSIRIYFFGYFMMSLQMAGQNTSLALGRSRQAIFFSLLRKAFIVVPLTVILPHIAGLGVNGVFLAEPISNFIGGAACYGTMLLTIWPELIRREKEQTAAGGDLLPPAGAEISAKGGGSDAD